MIDFKDIVNKALTTGQAHMRPVIEKELFHYDILYALNEGGLLDELTFQGGTSLRLCYGAPRYSEDLDFTGGYDFDNAQLINLKDCVMDYLGKKYGLDVNITTPKQKKIDPFNEGVNVLKWQISIITAPERRDIPRQRIKLEVANIESYTRELQALQRNYEFLPDGYTDTFVQVQSLDEIMADKIVSLVNSQRYIRYRDIWDLRWLIQQRAQIDIVMIKGKIEAYKAQNYLEKLIDREKNLLEIIKSEDFQNEMRRFIPLEVQERTLDRNGFSQFLSDSVGDLLIAVQSELDQSKPIENFRM